MVVIVEGIDRVGKTTLVGKLCEALGYQRFRDDFRYMPGDRPWENVEVNTEKINTLMNLIEQGLVGNVVLDRFHFTERVYGELERGYINKDIVDVDERLGKLDNVVLVWVQATDIVRSSREHGKDMSMHEDFMSYLYDLSKVKRKVIARWADFDKIVEELKCVIKD